MQKTVGCSGKDVKEKTRKSLVSLMKGRLGQKMKGIKEQWEQFR